MDPETLRNNESGGAFWASPCGGGVKRGLLAVLVACFVVQTALVYLDPSESPPLSEMAEQGRRVWHRYNCQTCHQFYGLGGFLGPDLTNAAPRLTPQRLRYLLTEGSGRMPAFDLSPREIAAVGEFLQAMNETGQGQAKLGLRESAGAESAFRLIRVIQSAVAEADDAELAKGFKLFVGRGCQGCHIPLGRSFTGAPDLLSVDDRLTRAQIMNVLEQGRAPDMPPSVLSPREREEMYEFLGWLGKHQSSLLRRHRVPAADGQGMWSEVPWWEF